MKFCLGLFQVPIDEYVPLARAAEAAGFDGVLLSDHVVHPERITTAVREGVLAPYDRWAYREAIYRFVADIPMAPSHPSYSTLLAIEEGLPRLAGHPWLLVWGMRDWCFTPEFLARFVELFPRAEVHRLADAGHWVVEDAPDEVASTLQDFLERHPIGEGARPASGSAPGGAARSSPTAAIRQLRAMND